MDDDPLRCDGCSRESWPEGSLVIHVRAEEAFTTVKHLRVTCGRACESRAALASDAEGDVIECSFASIGDVFDYADQLIAAHDWERGTVQRLSRVLAAIHRRRA